jgi:hypothetical protein
LLALCGRSHIAPYIMQMRNTPPFNAKITLLRGWRGVSHHLGSRAQYRIIIYLCVKALDRHYMIWEVLKDADLARSGFCRSPEWLEKTIIE